MATTMRSYTPAMLWIVGALATVWNGFGAYDYLTTRMRNMDYLTAQMPSAEANAMLAYVDSFPIWAQVGWGMGVWFGLLGSLLLLARSRWAVPSFGLSLIGMALSFGYQFTHPSDLVGMHEGPMAYMPYAIIVVGLLLFGYAHAMRKRSLLR